ncbi:hypothetical protein CMUS01_05744 [Colletotrichum musicola]|uniref:GED domain-containing protein n=1 Tax=Colletotrichum musicola TaxID=2175873 RepID=A0A8H6NK33_9PEZI|nr:hypothetical protein CMUS01_05744 [Colletotrichum musicola]
MPLGNTKRRKRGFLFDAFDKDREPVGEDRAEEDESEAEDNESTKTRLSPSIGEPRFAARTAMYSTEAQLRMPIEDDDAVTETHQHRRTGYAMHSALQFEEKALEMAAQWRWTESLDEGNPAIVSQLFREETKRWREISTIHLQLVWEAVSQFVHLALEHCVDPDFLPYLKRFIVKDRLEMLRSHAEGKLEELLRCHDGMNPAFHDVLCELKEPLVWNVGFGRREAKKQVANELMNRIRSALSSTSAWKQILEVAGVSTHSVLNPSSRVAAVLLEKVKESITDVGFQTSAPDVQESSGRRTAQQAAISLVTFVSYVNALVIQNGLLERLLYENFTHEIVSAQKAEIISEIVGEKENDVQKRARCEEELAILENALVSFQDFRMSYAE